MNVVIAITFCFLVIYGMYTTSQKRQIIDEFIHILKSKGLPADINRITLLGWPYTMKLMRERAPHLRTKLIHQFVREIIMGGIFLLLVMSWIFFD